MTKSKPRRDIKNMIKDREEKKLLMRTGQLHGHFCPFVSLGVKASVDAINKLDLNHRGMEEILAIVEVNNCFTDGVQFVTGCSFGNNSLIYRDLGKTAVSFVEREGRGIRYILKKEAQEIWLEDYPKYEELFKKVVKNRDGSEEEEEEYLNLSRKISFDLTSYDVEEFFDVSEETTSLPDLAPIYDSLVCEECGEEVMASKIVEEDDKELCRVCSDKSFFELNGGGIEERNIY